MNSEGLNNLSANVIPLEKMPNTILKRKRIKPIPFAISIEEVYDLGKKLNVTEQRILFYTSYLTGARISEVLALQKRDVQFQEAENTITFQVHTSKSKSTFPVRDLPILIDGLAGEMVREVWGHRESLPNDEDRLFHYSRVRAWNIFANLIIDIRAIDMNAKDTKDRYIELSGFRIHPHYLRHCRATHLVVNHGIKNPYELMKWFGWTDMKRPLTYLQLDWRELLEAFKRPQGTMQKV